MPLRRVGLLLLLLGSLRADVQETVARAMVGSDVKLGCVCATRNSFELSDLYVYWQTSASHTVVMYYLPENSSSGHVDSRYRDRAHLSLDGMRQGDFSLYLRNVTPQDAQKFTCLVFRKSLQMEMILEAVVTLHVAANYSLPVISAPGGHSQDPELTFTCTSTDGYPRPNVYWINRTDNSLLDASLHNDTVFLNERGLFDVVSVLKVPRAPGVSVGCCVENVLLLENLTAGSQAESFTGTTDRIAENPATPHRDRSAIVLSILATLLVAAAVGTAWVCRSRCPRGRCTGAQAVTLDQELTDHP